MGLLDYSTCNPMRDIVLSYPEGPSLIGLVDYDDREILAPWGVSASEAAVPQLCLNTHQVSRKEARWRGY